MSGMYVDTLRLKAPGYLPMYSSFRKFENTGVGFSTASASAVEEAWRDSNGNSEDGRGQQAPGKKRKSGSETALLAPRASAWSPTTAPAWAGQVCQADWDSDAGVVASTPVKRTKPCSSSSNSTLHQSQQQQRPLWVQTDASGFSGAGFGGDRSAGADGSSSYLPGSWSSSPVLSAPFCPALDSSSRNENGCGNSRAGQSGAQCPDASALSTDWAGLDRGEGSPQFPARLKPAGACVLANGEKKRDSSSSAAGERYGDQAGGGVGSGSAEVVAGGLKRRLEADEGDLTVDEEAVEKTGCKTGRPVALIDAWSAEVEGPSKLHRGDSFSVGSPPASEQQQPYDQIQEQPLQRQVPSAATLHTLSDVSGQSAGLTSCAGDRRSSGYSGSGTLLHHRSPLGFASPSSPAVAVAAVVVAGVGAAAAASREPTGSSAGAGGERERTEGGSEQDAQSSGSFRRIGPAVGGGGERSSAGGESSSQQRRLWPGLLGSQQQQQQPELQKRGEKTESNGSSRGFSSFRWEGSSRKSAAPAARLEVGRRFAMRDEDEAEDEDDVARMSSAGASPDRTSSEEKEASGLGGVVSTNAVSADVALKFVLSSGRCLTPAEPAPSKPKRGITIDDEFEQYFAQLLL